MLRDPATAVAASKCVVSRLWDKSLASLHPDGYHPAPCKFCRHSIGKLLEGIEEFNGWAAYDPRTDRHSRKEVREFAILTPARQAELVRLVQYGIEEVAA